MRRALEGIGVFAAFVVTDWLWARYCLSVARGWPGIAAGLSATIVVTSGLGTIAYVSNPWLLLPAVAGAGVGTYLAVSHG